MIDCEHEYGEIENHGAYMGTSNFYYVCKKCSYFVSPDFMDEPDVKILLRKEAHIYAKKIE